MIENPADAMPLSKMMGVKITLAEKERVTGELLVREDLCTFGGIIHGGSVMAFADALAGVGGYLNMPDGARGTATVECKTNFLAAAQQGSIVTGEAVPINVGRRLSVWLTTVRDGSGKSIAIVTQTQMAL